MRTHRLAIFALIGLGALALAGCYDGNSTADTVAPVFLSVNIPEGVADVDISVPIDVIIPTMTINSHAKSPSVKLSAQDDVILTEWVTTCTRTDGGTIASPVFHNFNLTVYVGAGGAASLTNFRIFPSDYFKQAPLVQLFPENGGYDKETNKTNIRQRLHIEVFGKTVAGKAVSLAFDVNLNFFYVTP
jgi:hypothetical protein